MALENVRKFEEKISGDEALQAKLQELAEAFDGDKEDARAIFDAVVSPVAAEVGLPYTYDEAVECAAQKDDEDLDADEVKAVAGGISDFCFIVGGGKVDAEACAGSEYRGANACAYVGVGFLSS